MFLQAQQLVQSQNARTGIETIDIGTPMWAMHSLRETVSIADHIEAIKLLRAFFEKGI